jgi:hypothetical protein
MKASNISAPKSAPAAPASSSKPSPLPVQSQAIKIADFIELAECGIGAIVDAGEMLVKLHAEDKSVFAKIMQDAPWMTVDILWNFYAVGTKAVHPKLLLYAGTSVYTRLSAMSYSAQEKALNNAEEIQQIKVAGNRPKEYRTKFRREMESKTPKPEPTPEPEVHRSETEKEKLLSESHRRTYGYYMIVIKPGKSPQFFSRVGNPINSQTIRITQDPDDPTSLIANLELYQVI